MIYSLSGFNSAQFEYRTYKAVLQTKSIFKFFQFIQRFPGFSVKNNHHFQIQSHISSILINTISKFPLGSEVYSFKLGRPTSYIKNTFPKYVLLFCFDMGLWECYYNHNQTVKHSCANQVKNSTMCGLFHFILGAYIERQSLTYSTQLITCRPTGPTFNKQKTM